MPPFPPSRLALAAGAALLCGCAAGPLAGAALQLAGIKAPAEVPDAQKAPRSVAIKLHAGANLNTDARGRPLALVAKIYKLRQNAAFQQAPYDGFLNPQRERELLGADLLEVKEVLLVPGLHYEVLEKVSREAYYIGVVALFRAPAAQRWRLAFGAAEAEQTGIAIGMNACAMSLGAGSAGAADPRPGAAARCE